MTAGLTAGCVVAVLGAESTGKTRLSSAIAGALSAQGAPVTLVSEYLREWCDRESRTPRHDEQAPIAAEQSARIAAAAAHGIVVADTTALMTAVYSDLLFNDRSLYPDALAAQSRCTITLLMALDMPWVADGLQRDGPHVREPVDAKVRAALIEARIPFSVVYGTGRQRLVSALNAINSIAESPVFAHSSGLFDRSSSMQAMLCDKCSDPVCEHRLFSDLLTGRRIPAAGST